MTIWWKKNKRIIIGYMSMPMIHIVQTNTRRCFAANTNAMWLICRSRAASTFSDIISSAKTPLTSYKLLPRSTYSLSSTKWDSSPGILTPPSSYTMFKPIAFFTMIPISAISTVAVLDNNANLAISHICQFWIWPGTGNNRCWQSNKTRYLNLILAVAKRTS